MKKIYLWVALIATLVVTGCTNLDFFERRLDDYEARLQKLENQVSAANRDIVAIREMIKAQANAITIKEYRPLDDNSGYVLTMSDGSKIVLKNGLNGQSSSIGVKRGEDGLLYWTLNGEYMYDSDGNKIQAKGEDGKNGITPQLRVNADGFWEYSFGGQDWHLILDHNFAPVKATGGGTNDLDITESNGYLVIKFKGQTFIIPLTGGGNGGSVTPNKPAAVLKMETTELKMVEGASAQLELQVEPKDVYSLSDVTWTSSKPEVAKVEGGLVTALGKGETIITASIGDVKVECTVKVEEKLKINIEVLEVSTIFANIKFTPSDNTRTYKAGVYKKSFWLEKEADKKGTFEAFDLPYWKEFGGEKWWSILHIDLNTGVQTFEPHQLGTPLESNTTYVVTAYGIDSEGNLTGDEFTKEFTTKPSVRYNDFTFKVEGLNLQPRSISATIVPSDNEKTYIATIQSKSYGDSYINHPELWENAASRIAGHDPILSKGKDLVTREGRRPNTEYYIIIFGYDKKLGLTTDMKFELVKTPEATN